MTETVQLPTGSWAIDPDRTTVTVLATKLGRFIIPATLTLASGAIEIDDNGEITNVEVAVDASSYAGKNAKRNEHVVSPDFLDAEAHPTIEFRSDSVSPSGSGYTSNGTVTMKGQSQSVEVTISNVDVSGDSGSFTATMTVDRMAAGVDKMPAFIIGQHLDVTVNAATTKQG